MRIRIHYAVLCMICISGITNAQEVKVNTNLVVESDGTLRMDNAATVWDDMRATLDKGTNEATFSYFSGSSGPEIWYFRNNGTVEAMSFTVQLSHTWKEGTTIYPHLHWSPRATASGNVEWNFEYTWANYDATTPQVFPAITTSTVVSTGSFTANTHMITALTTSNAGLSGTGKKISSVLICRIWRNSAASNDTYNADAGVLFLDFHYQIDTFGSRVEFVK